jgi:hypothetical protein
MTNAVAPLGIDKAYTDDALKTIGLVPDYETGLDINAQVREGLQFPRNCAPSLPIM